MLQHGFLDGWTYSVRTLQDHVSRATPALLWELNALPGAGGSCGGGKAPWEIVRNYVYLGKYEASGLWRIREMVKEAFKEDGVMDQQLEARLDRPVDEQTCVTYSVVNGQTRVAVYVSGHSIWA